MAAGTKKTYAELLAERNKLAARVADLQRAIAEAGRAVVVYHTGDWVAVPLPAAQEKVVLEAIEEHGRWSGFAINVGEGRRLTWVGSGPDAEERWEVILEDEAGLFPDRRHYLAHYSYTQADGITNVKVWALVPF